MVFKLVRVDTVGTPTKIQLPVGKHIIGRGKFLLNNVDDNRVSRNHAELEVSVNTVSVKSLHQNPCFITKKSTEDKQILTQNCVTTLSNGDIFGILPQTYWYELMHIEDVQEDSEVTDKNRIEQPVDTSAVNGIKQENVSNEANLDLNETDDTESPELPPTLDQTEELTQFNLPTPSDNASVEAPVKRAHSPQDSTMNVETKKVKTEPKESNSAQAGPSNDEAESKNENADNGGHPTSPAKPPNNGPLRERCMYGANCYRKNPNHKVQFSHPQDPDWGGGERGACAYGARCARRDPRHRRDYRHPPRPHHPPHPHHQGDAPPGKKCINEDSDEESSSPSKHQTLPTKRDRKTIKKIGETEWSDSDENERDPYATDDSDEWQPPSSFTESQD